MHYIRAISGAFSILPPSFISDLKKLFNLMILCSFVADGFGYTYIAYPCRKLKITIAKPSCAISHLYLNIVSFIVMTPFW